MSEGKLQEQEEKQRERELLYYVMSKAGLDIPFIIQQSFLGYKYRKKKKNLRESDSQVPEKLIEMYYQLNIGRVEFDKMRKSFMKKYVKNESEIEGVNDTTIHGKEEIAGLKDMYEYLHSPRFEEDFSIYSLKELHKKLFSHTPFPEYSGIYRNYDVYLPGTGLGLCEWSMIPEELHRISPTVDFLHEVAQFLRNASCGKDLLYFLDKCVELECDLVRVHPFADGNGRTIRAFINRLLEDSGLPPVYIKANERTEYHTAMNKAIGENDYRAIKLFYRYKICDSIIELDINERLKKEERKNPDIDGDDMYVTPKLFQFAQEESDVSQDKKIFQKK